MRESNEDIEQAGFKIVVLAPSDIDHIQEFKESFGPFPFPIVGDPRRKAYRGMGAKTMPKFKLLSKALIGTLTRQVKNMIPKDKQQAKFVKKSMTTQDVYIQGATWIFDQQGNVLFEHIDESPEKHAKIDEIKKVVNDN